ncbi:MAG: outer membrane lipoprotein carrier protein LolA [Planctomycetota bacterium]|nr:MAG: outer membrane lipoprotein carrier protein LolA [Planctomycetota bacterium]
MNKDTLTKLLIILAATVNVCWAGGCTKNLTDCGAKKKDANSVDTVLKDLREESAKLKSYEGRIEYLISQPLFESQSLRKGVLYYQKSDERSKLRINFETLKQDDEEEEKYIQQYIFDGVWLTQIDYQIEQVKRYQQAEVNEPVDAFELARRNFPIIGFSKTEDLKKEFEIKLVEQQGDKAGDFVHLQLKVKPDSVYKDDYTAVDFWIDKKLGLPAKIVATSTEEDIYRIEFLNPKVNESIDKKVFEFKVPKGFGEEIVPLKKS